MARQRMVTRTVEEEVCEVLVCDVAKRTTTTAIVTVVASLDEKHKARAIEKACKSINGDFAVVAVLSASHRVTLYGMEESAFLALAKVLPPRSGADDSTEEAEVEAK